MTEGRISLREWLAPRLAEVPRELAEAVRSALRAEEAAAPEPRTGPGAERLGRAALHELDAVAGIARDRGVALRLLAADALLTYAFEAAADPELGGGVEEAAALARRLGPGGRLGARLAEAAREDTAEGGAGRGGAA